MELPTEGGVAILFSKHFDSEKLKNICKDINRCFAILTLDINSVPFVLCNLYAPNVDDLDFFKTWTVHIDTLELGNIIMGGDFNFIVTDSMDCFNKHFNNWKVGNYFVEWAENKCLVGVVRFMNP